MDEEAVKSRGQSEYNSAYYAKNKDKIQQSRSERYRTDPDYRQKIQEAARERKRRLRDEKREAVKKDPSLQKTRGISKPKVFLIEVNGMDHEVVMMTAGQLAKALRRKPQTLRLWENKGILPEAMYRSNANDRLYTEFQVRKLKEAYDETVKVEGLKKATYRIKETIFPKLARAVWEEYPLGVDPAE